MRTHANSDPPLDITPLKELTGYVSDIRHYKLITPLFGGGVETHACDPIGIIRASEIRGQLRFWWRACRGGQYASLQAMKEAEDAIWGKAHTTIKDDKGQNKRHGAIQISVEVKNPQEILKQALPAYVSYKDRSKINLEARIPAYAAFPLQPSELEVQKPASTWAKVYPNIEFILTIKYPSTKETSSGIYAALWAWETFGGVGARTRRGFGALQLRSSSIGNMDKPHSTDPQDVIAWIETKLAKHVDDTYLHANIPHLSLDLPYGLMRHGNNANVWFPLIEDLKSFRQSKVNRKNAWPDKDAAIHALDENPPNNLKFPRAVIGLPIVFQVAEIDASGNTTNKKVNITLQGKDKGRGRYASPLLLRPLAWEDLSEQVGLVLLLEGTDLPDKLQVEKKIGNQAQQQEIKHPDNTRFTNTDQEVKMIPVIRHRKATDGKYIDVKQALFDYLLGERK
jgi:CRISPR-associated protein Cmr1